MAFVTHLESALDGTRYPAGEIQTTHQGRPLWVRYDLDAIRNSIDREELKDRSPGAPLCVNELGSNRAS